MDAEEHHLGGFIEDVLGAVAVMDVPIDDQDPGQLVSQPGVVGGEGDVVEQAEAHAARRRGMMAGRTDQAQGVGLLAGQHGIDGGNARSRGSQRDLERLRADRRVGVDVAAAVLGQLLGHVDHAGRVQLPDGLFAHGFVSARGAFLDQAGLVEPGRDAPQAVRSFRMPSPSVVLEEQLVGT